MNVIPNSWGGTQRLREFNPNHEPGGTPKGGQFAATGKPGSSVRPESPRVMQWLEIASRWATISPSERTALVRKHMEDSASRMSDADLVRVRALINLSNSYPGGQLHGADTVNPVALARRQWELAADEVAGSVASASAQELIHIQRQRGEHSSRPAASGEGPGLVALRRAAADEAEMAAAAVARAAQVDPEPEPVKGDPTLDVAAAVALEPGVTGAPQRDPIEVEGDSDGESNALGRAMGINSWEDMAHEMSEYIGGGYTVRYSTEASATDSGGYSDEARSEYDEAKSDARPDTEHLTKKAFEKELDDLHDVVHEYVNDRMVEKGVAPNTPSRPDVTEEDVAAWLVDNQQLTTGAFSADLNTGGDYQISQRNVQKSLADSFTENRPSDATLQSFLDQYNPRSFQRLDMTYALKTYKDILTRQDTRNGGEAYMDPVLAAHHDRISSKVNDDHSEVDFPDFEDWANRNGHSPEATEGKVSLNLEFTPHNGNESFSVTRVFGTDGNVYHSYFAAGQNGGEGFHKRFFKGSIEAYIRHGFSSVEVSANIDVGAYTWARDGFKGDVSNRTVSTWANRVLGDVEQYLPETVKNAREVLKDSPDGYGLWNLADMRIKTTPEIARLVIAGHLTGSTRGSSGKFDALVKREADKGVVNVGRIALRNQGWHGTLELDKDSDQLKRLARYMGGLKIGGQDWHP